MNPSDEPNAITLPSLQTHLQLYPSPVPPKLQDLDKLRLVEIPAKLAQRKKDGEAFLSKTEVSSLVEWKLKHGSFRPSLANLVASNTDSAITSTTKLAFATYETDNNAYIPSITTLCKLRGIGPATASLLLSCYDPVNVPFFSDELFRYVLYERGAGRGWDRKIKYSMKEYSEMYGKVKALRERVERESGEGVSAVEVEMVAYVLGRGAVTGGKVDGDGEKEGGEGVVQSAGKSRKRGRVGKGKEVEKEGEQQQQRSRKRRKKAVD